MPLGPMVPIAVWEIFLLIMQVPNLALAATMRLWQEVQVDPSFLIPGIVSSSLSMAVTVISRYVDGALTGSSPIAAAELPFGRYTLSSQLDIIGFAFTSEGYANSVSLREGAISHGHAVALGKASADGLPAQLPEVPSYVASWVPAGNVADRGTDIGAILDAGDAVIDQASIQLSLDGDAQNAQISKSGSQFTISVDRSLPFALAPSTHGSQLLR